MVHATVAVLPLVSIACMTPSDLHNTGMVGRTLARADLRRAEATPTLDRIALHAECLNHPTDQASLYIFSSLSIADPLFFFALAILPFVESQFRMDIVAITCQ